MKGLLLICAAFTLTVFCLVGDAHDASLDEEWQKFKETHNKRYPANGDEESTRRTIWESNSQYIKEHNQRADSGKHRYYLAMNNLGDLRHDEIKTSIKGYSSSVNSDYESRVYKIPKDKTLPDAVDWRRYGYVTDVKNQLFCGASWAFSASGALEGQIYRKTGKLIDLSEQQLIDCSLAFGNDGCRGGNPLDSFTYTSILGIESQVAYPYQAMQAECTYSRSNVYTKSSRYSIINSGNETELAYAIAFEGPISVALDTSQPSFYFYGYGIYQEEKCSSDNLDHAALVVGYTPSFWLVKNSWGSFWGEHGYILISRNITNLCGIATAAVFPIV